MNAEACATVGARLAALIFDKRARGGRRPAEAHLSEIELAAMLALAVEEGWKRGFAAGKGEPIPEGVTTAHGRLVALAPDLSTPVISAEAEAKAMRFADGMVLGIVARGGR